MPPNGKTQKILAIFDFCDTLINGSTTTWFVEFTRQKHRTFENTINNYVRILGRRSRLLSGLRHKRWQLRQLKGLSFDSLQTFATEFVEEALLPAENQKVVDCLQWHKAQGHEVAIVSGGFNQYIDIYAKKYNVDYTVTTCIEIKDGRATGRITGMDCMGVNKLRKLDKELNLEQFDLNNSYAYSDHESDIPLLSLVGNATIVFSGQEKEKVDWAKLLGYKVLHINNVI